MSEEKQLPAAIIQDVKDRFINIVEQDRESNVVWAKESVFALQQVSKSDLAWKAACNNPTSLKHAITNVASIGLSLNPATAYAYLVPRDNAICLDISYRGLIKIATDTGSIEWARADVVYEKDTFIYHGPAQAPEHEADPFSKDRGAVKGVYCIAKTAGGDILTDAMSEDEIEDIRSKSKSISSSYSPWKTFPNEMRKKAVLKRASKTWPKTERHERLDKVIEYINKDEGIDFDEIKEEDVKLVDDYIHQKNGAAIDNLFAGDVEEQMYWSKIIDTFSEKGKKIKFRDMVKGWRNEANDYVSSTIVSIVEKKDTPDAGAELYKELNEHERVMFWRVISPDMKIEVENILHGYESGF